MARSPLVFTFLIIFSTAAVAGEPCDLNQLSWLSGDWVGEAEGVVSEEIWSDAKGGVMLGVHRDVRGERLLGFEFLRIVQNDAGIAYLASPGGREPTPFPLVKCGDRRAVFENANHDFPNRIAYWLDDQARLHAVAEGFDEGEPRLEWVWTENDDSH